MASLAPRSLSSCLGNSNRWRMAWKSCPATRIGMAIGTAPDFGRASVEPPNRVIRPQLVQNEKMLRWRPRLIVFALPLTAAIAIANRHQTSNQDTCLAFVSTNLAKGNGNWYTYDRFSEQNLKIQAGDVLVYTIL